MEEQLQYLSEIGLGTESKPLKPGFNPYCFVLNDAKKLSANG